MSRSVFLALFAGHGLTHEDWYRFKIWQIVMDTGLTLAEARALTPEDIWEYDSIKDGINKVRSTRAMIDNAAARARANKRRRR